MWNDCTINKEAKLSSVKLLPIKSRILSGFRIVVECINLMVFSMFLGDFCACVLSKTWG